jgi:hypothetical protein
MNSYVVTSQDKEEMKTCILAAKRLWKSCEPTVSPEFVNTFSRRRLTGELVKLFEEAISRAKDVQ